MQNSSEGRPQAVSEGKHVCSLPGSLRTRRVRHHRRSLSENADGHERWQTVALPKARIHYEATPLSNPNKKLEVLMLKAMFYIDITGSVLIEYNPLALSYGIIDVLEQ